MVGPVKRSSYRLACRAWAIALVVVVELWPTVGAATPQALDVLILEDGRRLRMRTFPLTRYLLAHPEIKYQPKLRSSGNWRGHVETWKIDDGYLVLCSIDTSVHGNAGTLPCGMGGALQVVFAWRKEVWADWYSGTLIAHLRRADPLKPDRQWTPNDVYLAITVEAGVVTGRREVTGKEVEALVSADWRAEKAAREEAERKARDAATRDRARAAAGVGQGPERAPGEPTSPVAPKTGEEPTR